MCSFVILYYSFSQNSMSCGNITELSTNVRVGYIHRFVITHYGAHIYNLQIIYWCGSYRGTKQPIHT